MLALRAKLQTGCSLRVHHFFQDFYFSDTRLRPSRSQNFPF
uniref:Uncharacterized protein n=1 Tax=Candidatus Kentrum sp. SD TaxID=2126332 RepID=A0A451BI96_9GAMM|nr:MAG: hypothetical protein BECKSD772D_GA0070982_10055 [Candidatus Kentron sp. SD]